MLFRARQYKFEFPRPALLMGIVNVTPDSFSDGGQFLATDKAIQHALSLVEQGADILDIGGESTRPGATPVIEAVELTRVIPVIEELSRQVHIPISIDTVKPNVARAALKVGASIVNDIAANRSEPTMWQVVAEAEAGYICMHMQGTPQTMQAAPDYKNIVVEIGSFFAERLLRLREHNVSADCIALDPGLGFGKTVEHNLQLLANLGRFEPFGRPMVLGASRKSFIGRIDSSDTGERLPGSLACACLAVSAGARIIRAHDVAETRQAMRVAEAILNQRS